ncbi:MAG: AAA family ATPase [Magnetococcales bacterium]|nr:AAA family ATPase [Magnetococcales bacterium]
MNNSKNPNRIPQPEEGDHHTVDLHDGPVGVADRVHLMTLKEIDAVNAAVAAGRPLLVRGEPGTGKSQMARAAATLMGRAFVKQVVDARTEPHDLMWRFDAVRRLAEAQMVGALGGLDLSDDEDDENGEDAREKETPGARRKRLREELALHRFMEPGPLWWAFDWKKARKQCRENHFPEPQQRDGGKWENGCVVLLDEIDKAEAEIPNGLLDALGARSFTPPGRGEAIEANEECPPLVIITTNDERALPAPFLRRCLVLHLALPKEEMAMRAFLVERGRAHFKKRVSEEVLEEAAFLLWKDRQAAEEAQVELVPGQAEYLDLLRAVITLESSEPNRMVLLERLKPYVLGTDTTLDSSRDDEDET